MVGTYRSLWDIHCIWDINVRDTEVQLYMKLHNTKVKINKETVVVTTDPLPQNFGIQDNVWDSNIPMYLINNQHI